MISIVVSSYQDAYFIQFERSVAQTIGVDYEIIKIDNPGLMGIGKAYNTGASKARYDIICFSHEDIIFNTKDWGRIVIAHFQNNPKAGLLGVAGTTYKSYVPAGWGVLAKARSINLIQHHKFLKLKTYHHYENPTNTALKTVACVDGVWMCTTKSIVEEIPFDETTLTSFHCYDLDFSLNVLRRYTVSVTFDVLIEHFSEGKNDAKWIEENLKFYNKWRHFLPVNMDNLPIAITKEVETTAGIDFIYRMSQFGFPLKQQLKLLYSFLLSKHIIKSRVLFVIFRQTGSYLKQKLINR